MTGDDIGDRGQWLFCLTITELCGRSDPYFRPWFLGDKFPTFDYLVELVDYPSEYFFVQVKATTRGYTLTPPPRLNVQVSQGDVNRMVACPAPAYVVGLDVRDRVAFLLSVNEPRAHIASLTTEFRIDCKVLGALHDEVHQFWSSRDMALRGSRFRE
jgi:hypothetical protein